MRITSVDFMKAAYAEESDVFPILLMTITHSSLSEPIRVSTDPTQRVIETTTDVIYGTISNGETYLFYPLSLSLPSEADEGPANMRIEIDNIHRDLTPAVRGLNSPPSVTTDIVLSSDVDNVIATWPEYLLVNWEMNAMTISGDLMLETLVAEPYPAGSFNPADFPGAF